MFELIRSNKRRSALLVAGFVVTLTLVGLAFGALIGNGTVGTVVALVFSAVMAFASYWKADAIALAVSRAKPTGLKGTYIKGVSISASMGPGVAVDVPALLAAAS